MTSLVEVTSSTYLQDLLSSRGEKKKEKIDFQKFDNSQGPTP